MSTAHTKTEVLVGMFVMLGLGALGYLSVSIGGLELVPPEEDTGGAPGPGAPMRG